MTHKIQDLNRRNLSFSQSKVREVLPEYFAESYPNLVLFLEKYYEYLEGESADAFKREVNNLFVARDPEQVDEEKLDYLLQEIGNGLKSSSFFDNPRLMTSLLSRFYRVKGSLSSIEGFFRGFFGQEVTVEYPKNKMFIVGESEVGFESLKFIQDNKLYQIFSILIKSAIPTAIYNDLYVKFVHPAGFYYAGQVELESPSIFGLLSSSQGNLRESAEPLTLTSISEFSIVYEPNQLTGLYDSGGDLYRISFNDYINSYKDLSTIRLDEFYPTLSQMMTPQSYTFDNETGVFRSVNVNDSAVAVEILSIARGGSSILDSNWSNLDQIDSASTRNLVDIDNDGTVDTYDSRQYLLYKNGALTSGLFYDYITQVIRPVLLENEDIFYMFLDSNAIEAGASVPGPNMSLTFETFDNDLYTIRGDSQGDSFY